MALFGTDSEGVLRLFSSYRFPAALLVPEASLLRSAELGADARRTGNVRRPAMAVPGNRGSPFVGLADQPRRHRRRVARIRENGDHPQVGETQLLRARRVDVPRFVVFHKTIPI